MRLLDFLLLSFPLTTNGVKVVVPTSLRDPKFVVVVGDGGGCGLYIDGAELRLEGR